MNSKGSITIDYLLAFFLVSGLSLVVMTFSITLSMVEVAQYMAFSSARTFMAGNTNIERQIRAGKTKFSSLKSNPAVAALFNGGWFELPENSLVVDANIPAKYPAFADYQQSENSKNLFHGVAVGFVARVLDFQIPFFGGTKTNKGNDADQRGFSTNITAFVGREPTFDECYEFNSARWENIKNLAGGNYSQAGANSAYAVLNDNGC